MQRIGSPVFTWIAYGVLGALSLAMLLPVLYIVSLSLQTLAEASALPPTLLPAVPQWANFAAVVERIPIASYFLNSLIYTASTTLILVVIATLAAYATVKLEVPGHRAIEMFFIACLLVPPAVKTVPLYTMVAGWGWVDSWWGLALPTVATGFGLFFMRQYMLTIPDEVVEAARLDGCAEWQIVVKIIFPLALPGIATLALLNFVFRWNDYLWPLVVTRREWVTLPVGLATFKTSEQLVTWNLVAAGAVVALVPVVLLFVALRDRIMEGMALQAGK